MVVKLTRRRLLIGAGATATLVLIGSGTIIAVADPRSALVAYFREQLPGVEIDEDSARRCADDFMARWDPIKRKVAAVAWGTAGVDAMSGVSVKFEIAARLALTMFLTESNFFDVDDPRTTVISYFGLTPGTPCATRFGDTSLPDAAA